MIPTSKTSCPFILSVRNKTHTNNTQPKSKLIYHYKPKNIRQTEDLEDLSYRKPGIVKFRKRAEWQLDNPVPQYHVDNLESVIPTEDVRMFTEQF